MTPQDRARASKVSDAPSVDNCITDTRAHASNDIAYVDGLQAHIDEGGAVSAKNVSDLIAMVRWNAKALSEAQPQVDERAVIVAFLGKLHNSMLEAIASFDAKGKPLEASNAAGGALMLKVAADAIERADHLKDGAKGGPT